MGVELDGELLLHRFDEGSDESDPGLLWFIDIVCGGVRLPFEAEAVRDWLLEQNQTMSGALSEFCTAIAAGIDANSRPLKKEFPTALPPVKLTISCSAVRRVDAPLRSTLGIVPLTRK